MKHIFIGLETEDIREFKHDLPFKFSIFQWKKKAEMEGAFLYSMDEEGRNRWRETEKRRDRGTETEDKETNSFVFCF